MRAAQAAYRQKGLRMHPFLRLVSLVVILWGGIVARAAEPVTPAELRDKAHAVLARLEGEIVVSGLRERVEVLRDRWGVPHIYAKNQDDLFFAQGFVCAQ